jgi:hypothetical protein
MMISALAQWRSTTAEPDDGIVDAQADLLQRAGTAK